MKMLRRVTEEVLPAVAAGGRLGDGVEFLSCDEDGSISSEAQFASSVYFVNATFRSKSGRKFCQSLVVKCNFPHKEVRNWLKLDQQFQNEVIAYEKVLPYLVKFGEIAELFPRYFYGFSDSERDGSKYVVVLENLKPKGFQLSQEAVDLDYDHCALAFKKLGIYHATSYRAKHCNPVGFQKLANSWVETRVFEDYKKEWWCLQVGALDRAAKPLLEKGEKVEEINRFREKLDKDVYSYKKDVFRAVKEPMGVMCHGDFCRNNVLFKYENGKPVDAVFFDVATIRYGSPMLDFCFFFFLNCSDNSRKMYKEEYLRIYHDALTEASRGVTVPSLEEFREEFRQKAIYGFLESSHFKPCMMMDPVPFNALEEALKSEEERAVPTLQFGGEKATQVISDMLREFIELGYVL